MDFREQIEEAGFGFIRAVQVLFLVRMGIRLWRGLWGRVRDSAVVRVGSPTSPMRSENACRLASVGET